MERQITLYKCDSEVTVPEWMLDVINALKREGYRERAVRWNTDHEAYEYESGGCIEIFRDSHDASKFAEENNLLFIK